MARTGRPKTDNPINMRISVRLDKQTYAELDKYCKHSVLSKGGVIREAVIRFLAEKNK